MTGKSISALQPSSHLEFTLRPLQSLSEQKLFSSLSHSIKFKIYETALFNGLKELKVLLDSIVQEESRMHESLKKYKRDDVSANSLSDFDKMVL